MGLKNRFPGFSDIDVQIPLVMAPLRDRISEEIAEFHQPEHPAFAFLDKTLIKQHTMRRSGKAFLFACRKWRVHMKTDQIKAMQALKLSPAPGAVSAIGEEISGFALDLSGGRKFDAVTSVPGASSGRVRNMSHLIAVAASTHLNIPYLRPLAPKSLGAQASSHPRTIGRYSTLQTGLDISGLDLLVIDDVVTSGAHARNVLKKLQDMNASATFIAWISA